VEGLPQRPPLSISPIAAISIVNWVYTWSLFIWPLIVATSAEMFTMELGRMYFQQEYAVDYGGIMAACVDHFAACPPRLPGLPHPHHRGGGKPCTT
jgi:ABC-type glycerol-3-phosphate transport system permease component